MWQQSLLMGEAEVLCPGISASERSFLLNRLDMFCEKISQYAKSSATEKSGNRRGSNINICIGPKIENNPRLGTRDNMLDP